MDASSVPLKQCSRKENCVNSLGCWLPATLEYFPPEHKVKSGLKSYCRKCACRFSKDYRVNNLDEVKRKQREYSAYLREFEPHKIRMQKSRYSERHREHEAARAKRYYHEHLADERRKRREYYAAHANDYRERARRWRQKNKVRHRANCNMRRLRQKTNTGKYTERDIEILFRSQKGNCWYCGTSLGDDRHIDHRIPLSRGGSNAPENLCLTCPTCNLSKGAKLPHEWGDRLL